MMFVSVVIFLFFGTHFRIVFSFLHVFNLAKHISNHPQLHLQVSTNVYGGLKNLRKHDGVFVENIFYKNIFSLDVYVGDIWVIRKGKIQIHLQKFVFVFVLVFCPRLDMALGNKTTIIWIFLVSFH